YTTLFRSRLLGRLVRAGDRGRSDPPASAAVVLRLDAGRARRAVPGLRAAHQRAHRRALRAPLHHPEAPGPGCLVREAVAARGRHRGRGGLLPFFYPGGQGLQGRGPCRQEDAVPPGRREELDEPVAGPRRFEGLAVLVLVL